MKRPIDFVVGAALLVAIAPALIALMAAVRATSPGPAIHWSRRVGKGGRLFWMPKLRTMLVETPQVATHQLEAPNDWLTPIGGWLRRTSLDELPQLWSVVRGDMSFVGPRPALFNQADLIQARADARIDRIPPGLTGWAQVNGRDELSIAEKVAFDAEYVGRQGLAFDLRILLMTVGSVARREGIREGSSSKAA
ncbi:sugar transferase [Botrimarina sp.]|uniref:sugar transferase n=1 Tax=Botrimarina sp. TaxID=2795802 RepID=UPI0032EF6B16